MQDRFKFRIVIKKSYKTINGTFKGQRIFYCNGFIQTKLKTYFFGDNKRLSFLNSEVEAINQCTGLKDKNGKLIYEGDILKGKKDMICSPHSSRMVDKVGVVEIPQNMFVASCRDIKNNCTLFCQNDWVKTEVIGNMYQNHELLEE